MFGRDQSVTSSNTHKDFSQLEMIRKMWKITYELRQKLFEETLLIWCG